MQKRFVILLSIILLLSISVVSVTAIFQLKKLSKDIAIKYLDTAVNSVADDIIRGESPAKASAKLQQSYRNLDLSIRISVIETTGQVLFDSEANVADLANHLQREEVQETLQSGLGAAERYSISLSQNMVYSAKIVPNSATIVRAAMPLSSVASHATAMIKSIIIVALVALVLLVIFAIGSTKRLTKPLRRLEKAAEAMEQGDLEARVPRVASNYTEIYRLSQAFNAMGDSLLSNHSELNNKKKRQEAILDSMADALLVVTPEGSVTFWNRQAEYWFNRGTPMANIPLILLIHSEKTEQIILNAAATLQSTQCEVELITNLGMHWFVITVTPISKNNCTELVITFHDIQALRQAEQIRIDFVANVTHELRTPLTAIHGFVDILRHDAEIEPEKSKRFLEIIDVETERLSNLIGDVLVLSEIESGVSSKSSSFDLHAIVDDCFVLLEEKAQKKAVSLELSNADAAFLVTADHARIKQLLLNLIDNAIKYNVQGGSVVLEAKREGDGMVCISVEDSGIGILDEAKERIFERFYRVDKSRSRESGGTGLGLAIVKHIATLYDGHMIVRDNPSGGTIFEIRLKI